MQQLQLNDMRLSCCNHYITDEFQQKHSKDRDENEFMNLIIQ